MGTDLSFDLKDSVSAECIFWASRWIWNFILSVLFKPHFFEWILLPTMLSDYLLFQDRNNNIYCALSVLWYCKIIILLLLSSRFFFCNSNNSNKRHTGWWITYDKRVKHKGIWSNWGRKTERYLKWNTNTHKLFLQYSSSGFYFCFQKKTRITLLRWWILNKVRECSLWAFSGMCKLSSLCRLKLGEKQYFSVW